MIIAVLLGAQPLRAAAMLLCGRPVGLVGQNILLRWRVPWLKIGFDNASFAETKSLFAPAGAVMLLPIAQACYLQGSVLALGFAAGPAVVPTFTTARTLSRVGLQMCWLANTPMMPKFSAAAAKGDRHTQVLMVLATLAVSSLLLISYATLFATVGQAALQFWIHEAIRSSRALVWALATSIVFGGFCFQFRT
jgi:O-antigen/teichoic acid export membrane protein